MSCSLFVRTFLKSRKGGNLKKSLLAVFLLMIMLLSGTLTAYAEGRRWRRTESGNKSL